MVPISAGAVIGSEGAYGAGHSRWKGGGHVQMGRVRRADSDFLSKMAKPPKESWFRTKVQSNIDQDASKV